MDEKALNELLECSVCLDRLDSSSKVLPCQHTFCRWCLEEIVSTKKELRCPECRCLVETKIQDLPTNILLVRLLEGMKNAAKSSGSSNKFLPSRSSGKTGSGPTSPVSSNPEVGRSEQHKIPDLINQSYAKALYNYEATEPGDLSFKKGDIILLRKQVDENWFHGELQGHHGFFPASYVQIVSPVSHKETPMCKALYDFTEQNEKDCLKFQKDETLTVIRRIDDNWIEGKLGDKIGIFPKSFVEFNDAAKLLINFQASLVKVNQGHINDLNNKSSRTHLVPSYPNLSASVNVSLSNSSPSSETCSTSAAGHQVEPRPLSSPTSTLAAITVPLETTGSFSINHRSSNKRHSLTTLLPVSSSASQAMNRYSVEVPFTTVSSLLTGAVASSGVSQVSVVAPSHKKTAQDNCTGQTSPGSPISVYVALYGYKPQKDDEIELHKGDFYSVTEKCQDGWYKGISLHTGISGVFPGNYVQQVKLPSGKPVISKGSGVSASSTSTLTDAASVCVASQLAVLSSSSRHSQISVTRTHSFPKTSLLTSLNSRTPMRSQGVLHRLALGHPRPITNITQAQIRSTQSTLNTTSAQSLSRSMLMSSPVMSTGFSSSSPQKVVDDDTKSQSLPSGISANEVYQNTQVSSPLPKSSGRYPANSKTTKQMTTNHECHSPHHNPVSSSDELQSAMSTNTNITPPNVVIGATGGLPQTATTSKDKQEKKRDKERLPISLMKKISAGLPMRVRKSKSPIPDSGKETGSSSSRHQQSSNVDMPSSSSSPPVSSAIGKSSTPSSIQIHNHAHHHRSGSAPGGNPSRSPASVSGLPSHKKSSSVDSAQHSSGKPSKAKTLVRERYQCIVPYPPQSDVELELQVGDIVFVHKKREDGWYKGILQSSGKMGLFPGSFVEKV